MISRGCLKTSIEKSSGETGTGWSVGSVHIKGHVLIIIILFYQTMSFFFKVDSDKADNVVFNGSMPG